MDCHILKCFFHWQIQRPQDLSDKSNGYVIVTFEKNFRCNVTEKVSKFWHVTLNCSDILAVTKNGGYIVQLLEELQVTGRYILQLLRALK